MSLCQLGADHQCPSLRKTNQEGKLEFALSATIGNQIAYHNSMTLKRSHAREANESRRTVIGSQETQVMKGSGF